jgi:hypothetical protein
LLLEPCVRTHLHHGFDIARTRTEGEAVEHLNGTLFIVQLGQRSLGMTGLG